MENKLYVIADNEVTARWLSNNKAEAAHPHLKSYTEISYRARFLKGFCEEAWQYLRGEVASELGRRGLAHKPFPIGTRVLMSADILNAKAFSSAKDKEAVPAWRDGKAGDALQLAMVKAVMKRMFEHNVVSIRSDAFKDGASWAAFARLEPVITNVLKQEFGDTLPASSIASSGVATWTRRS